MSKMEIETWRKANKMECLNYMKVDQAKQTANN